jgi:hypothetical protein
MVAVMAIAGLALSASTALAQDSSAKNTVQPAAVNASVPQLSYGVSQVVQLAQAKIGDDTIIAYIKNSRNSYGLTVDQIIYLRQQGISEPVITAMLNQPGPGVAVATPTTPAPQPVAASTATTASGSTATVAPTVTYVQTVPDTTYYYQPYYYQPYYYPDYAWYPPVTFSFGWGWGGGWHGGGWHDGGGHGGGGHGGWHH